LDFNKLAKPDMSLDMGKLAWVLFKQPGKIPALKRLQGEYHNSPPTAGGYFGQAGVRGCHLEAHPEVMTVTHPAFGHPLIRLQPEEGLGIGGTTV